MKKKIEPSITSSTKKPKKLPIAKLRKGIGHKIQYWMFDDDEQRYYFYDGIITRPPYRGDKSLDVICRNNDDTISEEWLDADQIFWISKKPVI